MMKFFKFTCLLFLLILNSCLYDKQIIPTICVVEKDTAISFKNDVFPIIKSQCLECHNAKNHSDGIVIENYLQISESAKIGELYDTVVSVNGYPPRMPKGGLLSDCEVATIKKWIDQQTPNN